MSFSENNAIRKSYESMLRKRRVNEDIKDGIRGITSIIKNIFKSTTRGTDSDIDKERHSAKDAVRSEKKAAEAPKQNAAAPQQQNPQSSDNQNRQKQPQQKPNDVNATAIRQVSRAFLYKAFPSMQKKNGNIERGVLQKLEDWGTEAFCLFGGSNDPLAVCAIKKNTSGIDDVAITFLATLSEDKDMVLLQKLIAQYSYSKFLWVVPSDATSDNAKAYMNQRMKSIKVGNVVAFYKAFGSVPTFSEDVMKKMATAI